MAITIHCWELKEKPLLRIVSAVAPAIVGIARKKENSAAAPRDKPRSIAPIMVAADREVPGIMARH